MGGNGWVSWHSRRRENRLPLVVTPQSRRSNSAENGVGFRSLHYGTQCQLSIRGHCHADMVEPREHRGNVMKQALRLREGHCPDPIRCADQEAWHARNSSYPLRTDFRRVLATPRYRTRAKFSNGLLEWVRQEPEARTRSHRPA